MIENRHERRGNAARIRRSMKRSTRVAVLSLGLAIEALKQWISRNEARRRLVAEVVRMYGSWHAKLIAPRLMSHSETISAYYPAL